MSQRFLKILVLILTLVAVSGLVRLFQVNQKSLSPQENFVTWPEMVNQIESCNVSSAGQTHSLAVSVTLKNGQTLTSEEPYIDAIVQALDLSREKCGEVLFYTE